MFSGLIQKKGKRLLFAVGVSVLLSACGGGGGGGGGGSNPPAPTTNGAQAFSTADSLSMDGSGRFIAYAATFTTSVPAGVPATVGSKSNIYRYDRVTGATVLVSVSSSSTSVGGNEDSSSPVISADGNFIAFVSEATNLVTPNYAPSGAQILLRNVQTGTTELISATPVGNPVANQDADAEIAVSAHAESVAFTSRSTQLVSGPAYFQGTNVFVRNRIGSPVTELISISPDGLSSGKIGAGGGTANNSNYISLSDDGRFVAFNSYATNLVVGPVYSLSVNTSNMFLRDRTLALNAATTLLSVSAGLASDGSCDAALNNQVNPFSPVRNLYVSSGGVVKVVFACDATNLAGALTTGNGFNVYLHSGSTLSLVTKLDSTTPADDSSYSPALSADGAWLVFASRAKNLPLTAACDSTCYGSTGSSNIYRWNVTSPGSFDLLSRSQNGLTAANSDTLYPWPSSDGQAVVFSGFATNLTAIVPGPTFPAVSSVYRWTSTTKVLLASQTNGSSLGSVMPNPPGFAASAAGSVVAFLRASSGDNQILFNAF